MSVLQIISLLVSLGPYAAVVWKAIVELVQAHRTTQIGMRTTMMLAAPLAADNEENAAFQSLKAGGLLNIDWGFLIAIVSYIRQHPELIAAIKAIIAAFQNAAPPQPAPQPAPVTPGDGGGSPFLT